VSEEVEKEFGQDRRTFIKRLVIGTAFAAPVVSSFTMAGVSAITGSSTPKGINPNTTDPGGDEGSAPATAVVADPTTTG
jgi:hypothetical protein